MALRAAQAGRWTDRVEDLAAWVLPAAGLVLVLFGGVLGIGIYDQMTHHSHAASVDRTPVWATLLDSAPTIASTYATGPPVDVHATWQDHSGATHTGLVKAPQGLDAGSTVPIWIDPSGAAVPEPMSARNALETAGITAGTVILAGMASGRAAMEPRRGRARLT